MKYHFVKPGEERLVGVNGVPANRVTAEYGHEVFAPFDRFVSADLYIDGGRRVKIGNCEGSLMIIDSSPDGASQPINKIHIGELKIRRPHAESAQLKGERGPRVDLSTWDIDYALTELDELVKWRDPAHRKKLRREYEEYGWYCVAHRAKQLRISPEGLEKQIALAEEHLKKLHGSPDRRFVSQTAREIEKASIQMVCLMNLQAKKYLEEMLKKKYVQTKTEKRTPKVYTNDDVVTLAEEVRRKFFELLGFIRPKVNMDEAMTYWQRVDAWKEM